MLRVLFSNTKIFAILLIITLKLRMFFETKNKIIINCVIVDEIIKIELIIIE